MDQTEVGHRSAGTIRFASGVRDTKLRTEAAIAAGATLVAEPTLTPWETLNARLDSGEGFQLTLFSPVGGSASDHLRW